MACSLWSCVLQLLGDLQSLKPVCSGPEGFSMEKLASGLAARGYTVEIMSHETRDGCSRPCHGRKCLETLHHTFIHCTGAAYYPSKVRMHAGYKSLVLVTGSVQPQCECAFGRCCSYALFPAAYHHFWVCRSTATLSLHSENSLRSANLPPAIRRSSRYPPPPLLAPRICSYISGLAHQLSY